jgi:large subunit ribosomal protein L10
MDGSIKVTEDSTVLAAGEEVSSALANVLSELGIEPKEVGLDLRAVYSDGVLFDPEELAIDVDAYRADIQAAAAGGRNLSINAVYPTARTAGALLGKASGEATSLGLHAAVESPDLADDLVARADARMRALAAHIDDEEALPEELRGTAPAAPPATDADTEGDTAEAQSDENDADAESEADDADSDSDDEEEDSAGGDALGDMFG